MAKEEIQIKIDAAVESAEAAKSLGQLRKSLIEIQTLQAEIGDTSGANFDKLSQASAVASSKLAETRDRIGDIQDKTRTLEGTAVERLTGSFGLLKESIMNLDFDKAKIGAEGLLNTFTPVVDGKLVTGLAGVKGAFGMLADGVKTLGSTFMSVGKALLTNPIFLLAAAIIAIVAVVVLIMDKLGILKKIMDALGYAIGLVVEAFEALTDWLGLTTNAQEANAAAAKKNGEEQRKQIDATATEQKNYAKLIEGMTKDEIAAFNKKAGVRDSYYKNSFDIEKARLAATQETLVAEIKALNELEAAGGELTDEQKKDLEQRKADYTANAAAIKQVEMEKQKAIIDINKQSSNTLRDWQIKNIADANERSKAQLKVTKDEELRKIDVAILTAEGLNQSTTKLEQAKVEIEKYYNNESLKIDKQVQEQKVAKAKEAKDKRNAIINEGLQKEEQAQEALIKKTQEGSIERLNAEIKGVDAILAYKKKYQKALKLSNDEITIEEQDAIDARAKLREDFDKSLFENMKSIKAAEKDFLKKEAADGEFISTEELQRRIVANREALNTELADMEKNAQDKEAFAIKSAEIKAKYEADSSALVSIFRQKDNEDAKAALDLKVLQEEAANAKELENFVGTGVQKMRLIIKNDEEIAKLKEEQAIMNRDLALQDVTLTENQRKLIIQQTEDEITAIKKDASDKKKALIQEEFDKAAEYGQKTVQIAQTFADAIFISKKQNLDKEMKANMEGLKSGTKEYDAAQQKNFLISQAFARKQFNTNKVLQLSSAVIDGFKAITSSLSQSPIAIGPIPNPAGIASLAFAAITSAANIAKIAASKFQEGTPPAATVQTPDVGGGGDNAGGPTNFSPSQFFGLGQQTAVGMPGGPKPIKVYVTETDIRDVSDRVSVIEQRAIY